MSLTNRVSLFFLTALGLVLVGFSAALYFLADHHLHSRADHRLDTALQTLVAAIEVHPDDVEWEPLERHITMGDDPGPDQLRWSVHDLNGKLLDCSPNLEKPGEGTEPTTGSGWRVLTRRVRAGNFAAEPLGDETAPRRGPLLGDFPGGEMPGAVRLPHDRTYHGAGVVLTVAVADAPAAAELRHLTLAMAGISAVIWLTAAFWGRLLCRRALAPIAKMAASARSVPRTATDGPLLDVSPSRDELEDLGRAFNDLLADLRLSLERQHRFTGDASHQLRTPLAAMLASVEVSLRQVRSPAEYQRVLGVVQRRGVQLRQIIESLLFLARAESDCHLPDAETIDLAGWCRSWLNSWADHPRASDLAFHTGEGAAPVRANPALLGQVLDNLLDNACKYSEAGSPVVVSVETEGAEAVLVVSDRGCGITPDELPLICEPFFRSAQSRWTGARGVGLGLTVARRLITLLGGRLDVQSEPGHGSQFRVTLPVEPSSGDGRDTGAGKAPERPEVGVGQVSEEGIYMP
ncbi:sensor histidine kinase [Fimbriiglobus ruber]|uniref:histidine kinase n=1 Tax=Fimbriiglobus ruber TaxID=1908690 RepID=A0A225DHB2_9BACT|nr:HAMP domain-containing sensor histidine kinase [Fimbriiglobus ruber]OWK39064.1 two-component sensor histidine kinase [Fimbriiglobus ruber]